MVIRIDGDVIVYRAGFAAEHTFWKLSHAGVEQEFESRAGMIAHAETLGLAPGQYVVETRREVEPLPNALYNVRSIIRTMQETLQADDDELVVYLSGPTNYRMTVATILPYKGNRDKAHKPVHAAEIKAMMRKEYNCVVSDGEEADDRIGIDHYRTWVNDPHGSVIATIDKDLDMIPGLHYNFVKGQAYEITPEKGLWYFYRQLLTGDRTDNIPGLEGIGPARAEKILAGAGSLGEVDLWRTVSRAYADRYPDDWQARILEVGRLLWIRRNEGEWWNPPEEVVSDSRGDSGDSERSVRVPQSLPTEERSV